MGRHLERVAIQVRVWKGVGKVTTKLKQYKRAAAVSETIKKCNCMPTCSHKFCGCPAHY